MSEAESQRIDKWLWHARFARTRGAAQKLVTAGHVRVNRDKISTASRAVRPGDVLTIALPRLVHVVTVLAIADRRGPASEAARLYRNADPADAPDRPLDPAADNGGSTPPPE